MGGPARLTEFAAWARVCYMLNMREWMREKMTRRTKRGPNNSESTGRIGQELPSDQPKPLRPAYPEAIQQSPMEHNHPIEAESATEEPTVDIGGVFADNPELIDQPEFATPAG